MRSVSGDPDLEGMRHRSQERGSAEEPCWGKDHFQITCTAVLLTHRQRRRRRAEGAQAKAAVII